jgi:acetyl esterase/lipase
MNRKERKELPTARLGYHLGLNVVRSFMGYMAKHPVEDIQIFTQQWVPAPQWVKRERCDIAKSYSDRAAKYLIDHLGAMGVAELGGENWWQWRPYDVVLQADWIEMKKDYAARKGKKPNRVLLYIHGGAYFFGSTDEHGYQIQRHARKLKARCLAPRYRLSPQFPFPCGLQDALASYLFLLEEYDPKCILISGDSAGGGMTAALLTLLRDCGLPQPAGAMLISPWVDLTHSFPSICGDGKLDYIPIHGFVHRPSVAWPPPAIQMVENRVKDAKTDDTAAAIRQRKSSNAPFTEKDAERPIRPDYIPEHVDDHHITPRVELHGQPIYIRDQIQLYAPNFQLLNPLVSPVLNPSLGGLCPILIQACGGELLQDEQIYFAHKAANPTAYPPNDEIMSRWDRHHEIINKYPPTFVQLQVWDDLCHVPHTLAWTKPAKYMYRSVAQFGAWALARAQHTVIDIDDADSTSGGSDGDSIRTPPSHHSPAEEKKSEDIQTETHPLATPSIAQAATRAGRQQRNQPNPEFGIHHQNSTTVGKAGDPLPPFKDYMIRQRIDRNGNLHELQPVEELECMKLAADEIGLIKEAPVHRWRERQVIYEKKYATHKAKADKKRAEYEAIGCVPGMEEEIPPPTALVRRWIGLQQEKGKYGRSMYDIRKKKSVGFGLKWWSGFGNKHDKETVRSSRVVYQTLIVCQIEHAEAARVAETAEAAHVQQQVGDYPITSFPPPLTSPGGHSRKPSAGSGVVSGRRRSSVHSALVTDEGQADHNAIHTGNVSVPGVGSPSLKPAGSSTLHAPDAEAAMKPVGSSTLQVPDAEAATKGHRRNTSGASARSGAVSSLPGLIEENGNTFKYSN